MADNYLERRMEELHNGSLANSINEHVKRTHRSKMPLDGLVVVVLGISLLSVHQLTKLREFGAKVDIVGSDFLQGTKTAQQCGVRFVPYESLVQNSAELPEDLKTKILESRGHIDAVVFQLEEHMNTIEYLREPTERVMDVCSDIIK